jgi:integration host factor subunit alpha
MNQAEEIIPFGKLVTMAPSRPLPNVPDTKPEVPEDHTRTKADLAELLFQRVGLNKREAKDLVEVFFEEIALSLERGDSVKLSGFGNFQLIDKPSRPGRNPKTGELIPISARRVVTFHASQKLKHLVDRVELNEGA